MSDKKWVTNKKDLKEGLDELRRVVKRAEEKEVKYELQRHKEQISAS